MDKNQQEQSQIQYQSREQDQSQQQIPYQVDAQYQPQAEYWAEYMAKSRKKKQRIISILVAVFVVVIAYVGLNIYHSIVKFREAEERLIASGAFEDYHNQPHNQFNAPIVYYGSDLDRIVGVNLRSSEATMGGYSCTKYWNNRNTPTQYDDLTFYIFGKEKYAKKALKEIKENAFYEITAEGDNYVRGWLDGVIDADVENYYYVNGNLMVVACVTSVDESARDIDDTTPAVWGGGDTAQEIINLITDNF